MVLHLFLEELTLFCSLQSMLWNLYQNLKDILYSNIKKNPKIHPELSEDLERQSNPANDHLS